MRPACSSSRRRPASADPGRDREIKLIAALAPGRPESAKVWPLIPGPPISRAAQCRTRGGVLGVGRIRTTIAGVPRTGGGVPITLEGTITGHWSHSAFVGGRTSAQRAAYGFANSWTSYRTIVSSSILSLTSMMAESWLFMLNARRCLGRLRRAGEPTGSPVVGSQSRASPPVSVLATLKAWAGVVDWPARPHSSFRQDFCGRETTMTQTDGSRRRRRSCSCRSSSSR
jgi:hypothetical protein